MMNTIGRSWRRVREAFRMVFPAWGGGRGGSDLLQMGLLPGSRFDYVAEAGDPEANGAVSICLGWIGDNFPEARLVVHRESRTMDAHPLPSLLRRPNPAYDGDTLMAATAMSYAAHGNAYWLKVRDRGGLVRELWYVPHWQVTPEWPEDGSEFLSGYVYRVNGREWLLPPEDVVHFRFGIDPDNPRLGISRLRAVAREICTDNEASTYMAAILRNAGVPGMLIMGVQDEISDQQAELLHRALRRRAGGERRGSPVILSQPVKVERLQWSPEDLALRQYRQVPEDRICAALRLNPMVVGLTSGVEHKTYANYAEARRAAYEDCLVPMQRRIAVALDAQLLPDLGEPGRERCGWDYHEVHALQDEITELYRRNTLAVKGGWMTTNEARAAVGLAPLPGGDRLESMKGGIGVPAST